MRRIDLDEELEGLGSIDRPLPIIGRPLPEWCGRLALKVLRYCYRPVPLRVTDDMRRDIANGSPVLWWGDRLGTMNIKVYRSDASKAA